MVEHLLRRADLLDAGLIHDDDAVGHLQRLVLIVRHQQAGHVDLVVQPAQPAAQALPHLGVERAERFVEQQHACGSIASARASATRCRWPPESCEG